MDFSDKASDRYAALGDQENPFMAFRRFADGQLGLILQSFVDLPTTLSSKLQDSMAAYDKELRRRAQQAYDEEIKRRAQEAYEHNYQEDLRRRASEKWKLLAATKEGKQCIDELAKTRTLAVHGIPKEYYQGSGLGLDAYVARGCQDIESLSGQQLDEYITGGGWLAGAGQSSASNSKASHPGPSDSAEQGQSDAPAEGQLSKEEKTAQEALKPFPKSQSEQLKENTGAATDSTNPKGLGIVSTLTTTERIFLPDGTMHMKKVLKKTFADGREESNEILNTKQAQPTSGNPSNENNGKSGWFWG